MKLVSPLLKKIAYPALSMTGCLRWRVRSGLAVITYHGVLPAGYEPVDAAFDGNLIRAETLRQQLRLLKSRYNVISPEEVLAWRQEKRELPPRAVLLTCDDGLLNCLTEMLPVLQEERVSCLFFVTGASAGELRTMLWYEEMFLLFVHGPAGPFEVSCEGVVIRGELREREQRRAVWWKSVQQLSQLDAAGRASVLRDLRITFGLGGALACLDEGNPASSRRFGLLTRPELLELAAAGMTIGAHTLSHPILAKAPPELARAEIFESRTKLESVLRQRVWAFAYPFGDAQSVTAQVLTMAQEAEYEAAFVNFGGGLGTDLPPYAVPRIHVTAEMRLSEFDAHVSGFHARLQRWAGRSYRVE